MLKLLVYLFTVYIIVVNGQNIFFDCREEIISDVIQSDLQKKKAFLETEPNSLAITPTVNGEITEKTQIPDLYSNSYWSLTGSVNKITVDFTTFNTGGSYYIITGIAIVILNLTECQYESVITSNSYTLTYRVDGDSYKVIWFGSSSSPILKANINPITAQEISIERNIPGGYQYCIQYEIYGCPVNTNSGKLTEVPVLEYQLSYEPLSDTNTDYTGLCAEGRCYGGVGNLNNGIIGEITSLNLSNETQFTVWSGVSSLGVSFKLSNYFYITSVLVYSVLLTANAFNELGSLQNTKTYSISTNTMNINNIVQIVNISIQSNSTDYLAITEIVILGENNENIQDYYKKLYQPQICDSLMTSQNATVEPTEFLIERRELEYFILITAVCVLGFVLLLLIIILILFVCGIIVFRGKNISEKKMEEIIKSSIHESTMNSAQNRMASYVDVDAIEIKNFRERIRSRAMSDEYLEMGDLTEKGVSSVDKKFSSESDEQVFSKLFQIDEGDNQGYTPMLGARKEKFPEGANEYDEVYRSQH